MYQWQKAWWAALRMLVLTTVVLGAGFAAVGLLIGAAMPHQANGSPITVNGVEVGSSLLGQEFTGPEWFYGRPSAVNYDAMGSGASNLGPNNADLVASIEQRRAEIANREAVDPGSVPADAVTASASGLDPDISVAYALLQVPRVATERGMAEADVRAAVEAATTSTPFGFLGEDAVNVVVLNAELAARQ